LRKLKPTVVHFSGPAPRRLPARTATSATRLFFQGPDGRRQLVSTEALEETFGAAGASVKLVVLSACFSEVQARRCCRTSAASWGERRDPRRRSTNFAIGFYGGLGERESIAPAYKQGCAAISLEGLPDRPQLAVAPSRCQQAHPRPDPVEPQATAQAPEPRHPPNHCAVADIGNGQQYTSACIVAQLTATGRATTPPSGTAVSLAA
jgi:hypothetical protein